MLVINLRPAWLIPMHQNSKLLLMSRYMTVFHFFFYSNMIINELKGLNCVLLLVRLVAGLLPLNQKCQKHGPKIIGPCRPCQKVVPLYTG